MSRSVGLNEGCGPDAEGSGHLAQVPPPLLAANVSTAMDAGTFADRDHHGPPVPLCVEE
jgi:hypothetical protein